MTANTTFFVAQRASVHPDARPQGAGAFTLGTPVRDNISLKWATIWGKPLKLGVSLVDERW
jgi:hypothetical protein